MIPGPILLVALPLLAAVLVYMVRRWAILAAFFSVVTTGLLAFLCLRLPLDRSAFVLGREVAFGHPIIVLGQTLQLDPAGQTWMAFVFVLATVLYLFAWRMSQGRSFFSFSLVILALYALVVLLPVFSLSVLVFAVSVTVAVFIIQGGQTASVRGAQRYLLVTLLAVPLLLIAVWLMEPSLPDVDAVELARRGFLPAALGFGFLLAAFPFGTWMPAVAADAPPLVSAFIFTAGQAMAFFLAFVFLRDNPQVAGDPVTAPVIQLAGLVMAVSGGVMAAVQRDFGRLFGYAALSDLGVLLLAFAVGGSQRVELTLLYTVGRSVSVILFATSLAILRHRATTDQFSELQGMARRLPIATMGLMLGGLALAGFPLTAGFPVHWTVYRAASGEEWIWIVLLLASSIGITVGVLRGLNAMLGDKPRQDVARQPVLASLIVVALAVLTLVLGLYPQLLLESVRSAAQVFSLF